MHKLLVIAAVMGAFALGAGPAQAQNGKAKMKIEIKIDPELINQLLQKIGDGKFDGTLLKKLLEKVGDGKFDPAALMKMVENIAGNGKFDLESLKKLQDQFGKGAQGAKDNDGPFGKIDADALFKKLDTNKDGKLTKDEFMKLVEEFKNKIGEANIAFAKIKVAQMYQQLDPDGVGVTLEQFRKGVTEFQKKNK
jgi:Ca2+-binding EF-hand superfamily protein